ncbi:unnamed protein product [Rodentolepis nana]|uniref:G_PROTEIN_RECEP_F3_4 domain-containing protein n=1 Tax=Rodentolepis nana TaxID=102285 RepID=A0A0R3TKH5_RODNA|nr:unnamed protein product [Rodentolepis nana]
MCYVDFYDRTKIHNPMICVGAILIITSIFMITLGIARNREDVWVAGILVAIAAVPVFLFGLFIFCYLNRPGRVPGLEQDYSVSKFSIPPMVNVPQGSRMLYPIKGYDLSSNIYRLPYSQLMSSQYAQQK